MISACSIGSYETPWPIPDISLSFLLRQNSCIENFTPQTLENTHIYVDFFQIVISACWIGSYETPWPQKFSNTFPTLLTDCQRFELHQKQDFQILSQIQDFKILTQIQDFKILTQIKDFQILRQIKDLQILTQIQDSKILTQIQDCQILTQIQDFQILT